MRKKIVAGIVAEYNPFHNGHAHLISKVREAGADYIVAVMSGNFVQRGGPACAPKVVRANAAIAAGVDLVIELPLPFAMATAERFSYGAMSLLGGLGCVDLLAFGSECGDIALLTRAADAVRSPYCADYTVNLLSQGITYACARQKAVAALYGEEVAQVLASPNNTLAVEYIRQIYEQQLQIMPFTIQREGAAHDSLMPSDSTASASHLRNLLDLDGIEAIAPYVPSGAMQVYHSASNLMPFSPHSLNTAVLSALRAAPREFFANLPDVSEEGLHNRLCNAVRQAVSLDELLSLVKTKRYTLARIRRLIWSAYLGIPADLQKQAPPYIRVLAFNRAGLEVLSMANKTTRLPVCQSLAKLEARGGFCERFAQLEAKTTDLYTLGLPMVQPCGSDYRQKIAVR